ncbi:MAG: NAD(P)-binding protein, partial [Pseudomonadota bacterium]|nr:NAD(P)-binding protein [Pseudomonadota bacterium]
MGRSVMPKRALVIGSGFGGIAASLRARKMGFDVTLIERLDQLG